MESKFAQVAGMRGSDETLDLVDNLCRSKLYQEYENAFSEATGLPLALRPVETWQLPHHGKAKESPFCSLMARKSRTCAACLNVQQKLTESAHASPRVVRCPAGLSEMAVPVHLGDRLIGFLQTGQVFASPPSEQQFAGTMEYLADLGMDMDRAAARKAFFGTRVITPAQEASVLTLLGVFAEHLSNVSNQIVVQRANSKPPMVVRAIEFMEKNYGEDLTLGQVAKAVNASLFYFCKTFKKVMGICFTDYLSRIRIEKAKNLLLNPNLRVSEIAFEVGFQSLTHFNRLFKKILGQSPTEYRMQLPSSKPARKSRLGSSARRDTPRLAKKTGRRWAHNEAPAPASVALVD